MLSKLLTYFTQKSLEARLKVLPVNFNDPWWKVISDQKTRGIFVFVGLSITYSFSTQLPLYLGYIFENQRLDLLWILAFVWMGIYIFDYFIRMTNSLFQLHCIHSIYYAAHEFFLTVDPLFHSDRSSGVVLNKAQRASLAYEDLLDSFTSSGLLELCISAVTVVVTFISIDFHLGLIAASTILFLMSSNILFFRRMIPQYEQQFLEADDKLKATTVENLTQAWLIRSTFATNEAIKRLQERNKNAMKAEAFFWKSYVDLRMLFKNLYVVMVTLVGFYIFHLVFTNLISPILGTTLIATYLRGTNDLVKLDKPLRLFFRSYARITNFYEFMKHFGQQTFPVLSTYETFSPYPAVTTQAVTTLSVNNIVFDYAAKARIFSNHSLHLVVPEEQKSKLYGIIGPSGIGKTTLISILGGQLKPNQGTVMIDGIDIYAVDDATRRQKIALQSQVASSMRGTLAYNLLFGLPLDQAQYKDDDLINILERVGLWNLFRAKNGLKTFIGDGGFNLSGGQRQRLNFANLYLRARYFKPALVLIDEPTSSLDRMSERAITNMIFELSQTMVTIVIAHHIKTLEKASGIVDFSLLATEQEICFYSFDVLVNHSEYYKKLLEEGENIVRE